MKRGRWLLLGMGFMAHAAAADDVGKLAPEGAHAVVADARAPRDGKFIQKIGTYNPLTVPATIQIDRQKALEWLHKGAQPTDTVRRILSYKGVLFLKHLLRGVGLGLFDEATAMQKFQVWHEEHETKIRKRQEDAAKERRNSRRGGPIRRPERRPE